MIVDSSAKNIEQSQRCELDQSKINSDNMNLYNSQCEASKSSNGNVSDKASCSQGAGKSTNKEVRKLGKRKRASIDGNVICTRSELCQEIDCLFEYYKELSDQNLNLGRSESFSNNSLISCFLEESNLAYSKLVEVICEKLKGRDGVTLAYVRSTVLSIGQRMIYGITKADADVLEDESESCLWCWETRDMKLLPANQRGNLNARRAGRKKIHERISALSALLSAMAIPENMENYKGNLNKASLNLGNTLKVEEIRSLVEKKQKNDTMFYSFHHVLQEHKKHLRKKEKIEEMHNMIAVVKELLVTIQKAFIGWGAYLSDKVHEVATKYPDSFIDRVVEYLYENKKIEKLFVIKTKHGRQSWINEFAIQCGVDASSVNEECDSQSE